MDRKIEAGSLVRILPTATPEKYRRTGGGPGWSPGKELSVGKRRVVTRVDGDQAMTTCGWTWFLEDLEPARDPLEAGDYLDLSEATPSRVRYVNDRAGELGVPTFRGMPLLEDGGRHLVYLGEDGIAAASPSSANGGRASRRLSFVEFTSRLEASTTCMRVTEVSTQVRYPVRASGGKLTIGCYEVDAATARRVLARIDAGPVTVRGEWVTFDDERGRVKFAATGHVLSYDDVRRACSLLLGTEGTDGTEGATDSTEGA